MDIKKKLFLKKGYTIEVVSWENDGDNYRTKRKTIELKEDALIIYKICKELFMDGCNNQASIGNSMDGEANSIISEYIEKNPELLLTKDKINNLGYELMGGSEYYDFRVCESVEIVYSPEDILLEIIND